MSVELWYRTKVMKRSENGTGMAMPLLLVLDEECTVVDIQQTGTLRRKDEGRELPEVLIDIVTGLGGCWHDEDEQDFWERWLVYREVTPRQLDMAFESVRRMTQNWLTISLKDPEIRTGTFITLQLIPEDPSQEPVFLMELEVQSLERTVFVDTALNRT